MKNNLPKVIIDTDPGHDDALAILAMLLSGEFNVLAISTVAGNASIDKVTRNTQAILNLLGSNIPVYSGLAAPLKRSLITAVVHGESGLAGFDISETKYRLSKDAPEKIVELANKYPGEISILALGPLSNVARALRLDPDLPSKIKQIVIMGGAINVPGNKNRVSEFNFFVDPEAASEVMGSSFSKILVPLDACNDVTLQVKDFHKVKNKSLQKILIPMMEHFLAGISMDEGTSGILVYDALAAYYLLNPGAFTLEAQNVVVETKGEHTSGMSVAEKRQNKVESTNVDVVTKINSKLFKKDLFKIFSKKSK